MELAVRTVKVLDRLVDFLLRLLLIIVLLFGLYALGDTYMVFSDASLDDALLSYKPELLSPDGSNPTLAELAAINPDIRAWLTIDDTSIDYPITQGADNIKYINTDATGEFSLSGSIFLDYSCAGDFSDFYSLLYGHHMEGGVMFGAIDSFMKKDYFDKHTHGTLYLPDATYDMELFAILSVDAYDRYVFTPGAKSQEEADELLAYIRDNAKVYRDMGVTAQDRIIAMSTCADTQTNGRTVLYGKLTQIDFTQQGDETKTL